MKSDPQKIRYVSQEDMGICIAFYYNKNNISIA